MTFRDTELKYLCSKDDKRIAPIETLNFGSLEKSELDMQLKLIQPKFTILAIGGNIGWYSMNIAKRNPQAKIFIFEPIPYTYNYLVKNIKLNRLTNIKSSYFGFSDKEGTFDFYFDSSSSVNASLANVSNNMNIKATKCITKK